MTYEEAINLTKQGYEYGFRYLYDTTYQSCLYVIGEIVKDSIEAEYILQDAYMNAISKIDTLKNPEEFPSWFKTMATHIAINRVNENNSMQSINPGENKSPESIMDRIVNEQLYTGRITPEEAYEPKETSRLLHELIAELPEKHRQCILLFYMEEYSIKDIAKACQCSESTVKSRLKYGKKKLEEKTIELQKKGYVLHGVTSEYLVTWLLKTDMANKLKFVYGGAATSTFLHSLFTKLVNTGIITAVNSGLTNAVSSYMSSAVNSGMATTLRKAVSYNTVGGTATKDVSSTVVKGGIHSIRGKIITGVVMTLITVGLITAVLVTNSKHKSNNEDNFPEESGNVLTMLTSEEVNPYYNGEFVDSYVFGSKYKHGEILTITFLDTLNAMPEDAWDVSEYGDNSVMAWVTDSGNTDVPYNLYIAGDGGVDANEDSSYLFSHYINVESINFNNCFYTGNCTNMYWMFGDCESLTSLDLSSFDTSNVTDMSVMFGFSKLLTSLDLSSFDTSNVTDMHTMFEGCTSLTNLDLSSFDTSNVTTMNTMFFCCYSLTSLDLSNFNTSNVQDMWKMFAYCYSLTNLNLDNFDTSNVQNMWCMFSDCSSLTSLDLSSFDTSNVTNMEWMFYNCSSLTNIETSSNFITSQATTINMYSGTIWE